MNKFKQLHLDAAKKYLAGHVRYTAVYHDVDMAQVAFDARAVLNSAACIQRIVRKPRADHTSTDIGDLLEHGLVVATAGVFKRRSQLHPSAFVDGLATCDVDGLDLASHLESHGFFGFIECKNQKEIQLGDVANKVWRFVNHHCDGDHPAFKRLELATRGAVTYDFAVSPDTRFGFDWARDVYPHVHREFVTEASGIERVVTRCVVASDALGKQKRDTRGMQHTRTHTHTARHLGAAQHTTHAAPHTSHPVDAGRIEQTRLLAEAAIKQVEDSAAAASIGTRAPSQPAELVLYKPRSYMPDLIRAVRDGIAKALLAGPRTGEPPATTVQLYSTATQVQASVGAGKTMASLIAALSVRPAGGQILVTMSTAADATHWLNELGLLVIMNQLAKFPSYHVVQSRSDPMPTDVDIVFCAAHRHSTTREAGTFIIEVVDEHHLLDTEHDVKSAEGDVVDRTSLYRRGHRVFVYNHVVHSILLSATPKAIAVESPTQLVRYQHVQARNEGHNLPFYLTVMLLPPKASTTTALAAVAITLLLDRLTNTGQWASPVVQSHSVAKLDQFVNILTDLCVDSQAWPRRSCTDATLSNGLTTIKSCPTIKCSRQTMFTVTAS